MAERKSVTRRRVQSLIASYPRIDIGKVKNKRSWVYDDLHHNTFSLALGCLSRSCTVCTLQRAIVAQMPMMTKLTIWKSFYVYLDQGRLRYLRRSCSSAQFSLPPMPMALFLRPTLRSVRCTSVPRTRMSFCSSNPLHKETPGLNVAKERY